MDYNVPNSTETPKIEIFHIVTRSTATLSRTEGAGESGTIASYATIRNALNDALSHSKEGDGKEIRELNISPASHEMVCFALTA